MTTTAPPTETVTAKGPLLAYRTVDLVTTAMIGVALGVAYQGWGYVFNAVQPAFVGFPPASGLLAGLWFVSGTIAALVVRRPGAAVVAELLAACVEAFLGSSWGPATLISGLLQGIGVELAFAFFAYRSFRPWWAALGGILAASFECVGYEWWSYWRDWGLDWKLVYLAVTAFSGAVFCGLLAPALVRALAATGVLDTFPPGREHRQASAV